MLLHLRKSHVKTYTRRTKTGAVTIVQAHEDSRTKKPDIPAGQEVYFKPPGAPRALRGTVVQSRNGQHVIEGKRQGYSFTPERHTLPREHVWTQEEHAEKRLRSPKTDGKHIATAESNRRAEAGLPRMGISETEIIQHSAITQMAGKTVARFASSNDISPQWRVRGGAVIGEDQEFNDAVSEYMTALKNSLRLETSKAPEEDLAELRDMLAGNRTNSRIFATVTIAGRGAALRFFKYRAEQKKDLVDFQSADDDPELRRQLAPLATPAHQERDLTATDQHRDQYIADFIAKLPPLDAEILSRKFGLGDYDPQSNEDIAEALKETSTYAGKAWTRNNVAQAYAEALHKMAALEGIEKLKEFAKSISEHMLLRKSQQEPTYHPCPECGEGYQQMTRSRDPQMMCKNGHFWYWKDGVKTLGNRDGMRDNREIIDSVLPLYRAKTICIDFDGVIADYSQGFQGPDVFGEPLPGASEAIRRLHEKGNKVIIFTTRQDTHSLRDYLVRNGIWYDEINTNSDQPEGTNPGKPIADIYLDDRAVRFTSWAKTLADKVVQPLVKSLDQMMDEMHLIKSHIHQYTRKDGTVVQEHDDKRIKKHPSILEHENAHKEDIHSGAELDHGEDLLDHLRKKGWKEREVAAVSRNDREPGKKEEMPEPPKIKGANQDNVALISAQRTIQKLHDAAEESEDPASALKAINTSRANPYLKAVDEYRTALLKHFGHDVSETEKHRKLDKEGHTVILSEKDGKHKVEFAGGEDNAKEPLQSVTGKTARETVSEGGKGEPTFVMGDENTAYTAKMSKITTKFALVDVGDITTSHGVGGEVNTAYPQEIQPRDRARVASRLQIQDIANNLKPELYGISHQTSDGAPIVGKDGVVESGNGRSIALKLAYQTDRADGYKEWLKGYAKKVGLDPEQVEKMKQPMLVQVRQTEVDRAEFAKEANQSNLLGNSALEQAFSDAERIDDNMLDKYHPDEDGEIYSDENMPFIADFFAKLGKNEAASLRDKDGDPNKQAIERIQSAVFAKVYKSEVLTEMMTESAKPDVKNIVRALNMAAGSYAKIKNPGDLNMIPDALEAIDIYRYCKKNNYEIQNVLDQGNLYASSDAPAYATAYSKDFATIINDNVRSAKKLGQFFNRLAMDAGAEMTARNDTQVDMFGNGHENKSKHDLITGAKQRMADNGREQESGGFAFAKAREDAGDCQGDRAENRIGTEADRRSRAGTGLIKAHVSSYDRITPSGSLSHVIAHEDNRIARYGKMLSKVKSHADLHDIRQARFGHLPHWGGIDEKTRTHILTAEDHIHKELTARDQAADNPDERARIKEALRQGAKVPEKELLASGLAEKTAAGTQFVLFKAQVEAGMYLLKSHVKGHTRTTASGTVVQVAEHDDSRRAKQKTAEANRLSKVAKESGLAADSATAARAHNDAFMAHRNARENHKGEDVAGEHFGYMTEHAKKTAYHEQNARSNRETTKRHSANHAGNVAQEATDRIQAHRRTPGAINKQDHGKTSTDEAEAARLHGEAADKYKEIGDHASADYHSKLQSTHHSLANQDQLRKSYPDYLRGLAELIRTT